MMNRIIMGGSGSTGSSLLKNILNRHERIFAGEETALFSKDLIYGKWKKVRHRVLRRGWNGLRNFGFHIYNGADLLDPCYGWNREDLQTLAEQSEHLLDFADRFFGHIMQHTDADTWMEKTPANAATFRHFLELDHEGKVIHMTRNPYDTITSLWKRGFDLYYAVGIYLLNTASGLSASRTKGRYHEVKYENLVANAGDTVADICRFLEIRYDHSLLIPRGEQVAVSKLPGWRQDETAEIGRASVGRFADLPDEDQLRILEAVCLISINARGADYYGVTHTSIEDICGTLGYDYYPVSSTGSRSQLLGLKRRDHWMRIRRGYPTGVYYPLKIR